jgi:hypothetical protein
MKRFNRPADEIGRIAKSHFQSQSQQSSIGGLAKFYQYKFAKPISLAFNS